MVNHPVAHVGVIAIFAPLVIVITVVTFLKIRKIRRGSDDKGAGPPVRPWQQPPNSRPKITINPDPPNLQALTEDYLEQRDASRVAPIFTQLQRYFRDRSQQRMRFTDIPIHYITALLDADIREHRGSVREARHDLIAAEQQLSVMAPGTSEWNQALVSVEVAYERYGDAVDWLARSRVLLYKFEIQWGFRQYWAFKTRIRISKADSWFSTATLQPLD